MKTNVKLPDKLSELLRIALADLAKCERSKKYKVNMFSWHVSYDDGKTCYVCLAGAVLAKTVGMEIGDYAECAFDNPVIKRTCFAINQLRQGSVSGAINRMAGNVLDFQPYFPHPLDRKVTPYEDNPKQFKADMRQLADDLEAAGL